MTTPLHTQANRRNARHSTGPVTEAGRARSARNALKHGYCAADILMPGEDAEQFQRLLAGVQADWQPESAGEWELTDEIAVALWRRRRLRRAEAQLWAERCALMGQQPRTLGEAFAADSDSAGNAIEKLRRWWQGNERHLNRCQDRLALFKRLAGRRRPAMEPEEALERRRHAAREIDLLVGAPAPGEAELPPEETGAGDGLPAHEIGQSAERTQSNIAQSDQMEAGVSARAGAAVTPAPALPPGLPRRERRALLRKLAKAQRRREKPARPPVAA